VLKNHYRLISTLGQGGFGVVYEALDMHQNQRRCAIKRVAFTTLAEKQQIENEANILKHHAPLFRFVPDLYDFWSDPTHTYLVMECIDGPTLDQTTVPWQAPAVESFLHTMLKYLDRLHNANTIHRDLKPWNIKRTPQGRYVLLDFGIAKHESSTITAARGMGTVNYAPPEQVQGLSTDQRSDLYSLAATAYFLLTGVAPFQARMDAGGILPPPAQRIKGVSPHLDRAIMRMLAHAADDRPPHALAALDLLDDNVLSTIKLPTAGAGQSHKMGQGSSQASPLGGGIPTAAGQAIASYPFAPVPPMPASPTAQTNRIAIAPPTQKLAWRVFMIVALLVIPLIFATSVGVSWLVSRGDTQATLPTPSRVGGVIQRSTPIITTSAITATHVPNTPIPQAAVGQQASYPTNTPPPPTSNGNVTVTTVAETKDARQAEVADYWAAYDRAVEQSDWQAAIAELEMIISIVGETPAAADYPSPPYDVRMSEVSLLLADARLTFGSRLQHNGWLDEAEAQFTAVVQASGLAATQQAAATRALQLLGEARSLWQTVNLAWDQAHWQMALDALYQLQALEGFGDHALDPQDRQYTVAELIAMAKRFFGNEEPKMTNTPLPPTATPTPQTVPSHTATPTVITAIPLPTSPITTPVGGITVIPITPIVLPTNSTPPQFTITPILQPTYSLSPQPTDNIPSTPVPEATMPTDEPTGAPDLPTPDPTEHTPVAPEPTSVPMVTAFPTVVPTDIPEPYPDGSSTEI
jgi:serine/threonine protein kinase